MAKFICPKCKQKECVVDADALLYPDFEDFDLTFKCYACKQTFVAKYKIAEFWQVDKEIVKQYHIWKKEFEEKKPVQEDIQQMKLF